MSSTPPPRPPIPATPPVPVPRVAFEPLPTLLSRFLRHPQKLLAIDREEARYFRQRLTKVAPNWENAITETENDSYTMFFLIRPDNTAHPLWAEVLTDLCAKLKLEYYV